MTTPTRRASFFRAAACGLAPLLFGLTPLVAQKECQKDLTFALRELEKKCGHFFKLKGIQWKKVGKELKKDAKKAKTDQQHYEVLQRLVAHLRDGHARVTPLEGTKVEWPEPKDMTGPGMFWCRVGKKIYVKNSWSTAKGAGIEPGMEVVKVDKQPASKWLDARIADIRRFRSFSTDHQAFFYACHWGLAAPKGTRMKLELRTAKKQKKNRTLTYSKANPVPNGPAFYPEGMSFGKDVHWGKTTQGFGYVHIRRCKGNLPDQVEAALAGLGNVPGMILDFRGNSGGGFDHDDLFGRFVPSGKQVAFTKRYESTGNTQYGGPVVVIIDATARSAGETASGMFKEDGRAYMIGESPTAGMSASKETLELPSKKFSLYFAVHSNKARFQGGRGIEGIGIEPHETVAFDPADLAAEKDTLILHAEKVLQKFPQNAVPYKPSKFGWSSE